MGEWGMGGHGCPDGWGFGQELVLVAAKDWPPPGPAAGPGGSLALARSQGPNSRKQLKQPKPAENSSKQLFSLTFPENTKRMPGLSVIFQKSAENSRKQLISAVFC